MYDDVTLCTLCLCTLQVSLSYSLSLSLSLSLTLSHFRLFLSLLPSRRIPALAGKRRLSPLPLSL